MIDRYYCLPISVNCPETCDYCSGLGFRRETKSEKDVRLSLRKAKAGRYSKVILPCNLVFTFEVEDYLKAICEMSLVPVLAINSRSLHGKWFEKLAHWKQHWNCEFLVLVDQVDSHLLEVIDEVEHLELRAKYMFVLRHGFNLKSALRKLPKNLWPNLVVQAPYHLSGEDHFLSSRELYKSVKDLSPEEKVVLTQRLPGYENFDPRIASDMPLESLIDPMIEYGNKTIGKKKASVIIPVYNNRLYLQNTLRHLFAQDLPAEDFEVIVVDDGSSDDTQQAIKDQFDKYQPNINLRYIYFPRPRPRQMGDGQFRAGVARNLGVKFAQGEILVFLDSDILVPKDYLNRLLKMHEEWDMLQAERCYLKQGASSVDTNYYEVDIQRDCYVPEGGYWKKFYDDPRQWMEHEHCWKYVCTYGLSLRKELFEKIGWFNKNYIFYGFEDTDLGYRLVKSGYRLHKSGIKVMHLWHETDRSEFRNSAYLRQELLRKTARIFFYSHKDPEIFEHLRVMVDDGFNWRTAMRNLSQVFRREPSR